MYAFATIVLSSLSIMSLALASALSPNPKGGVRRGHHTYTVVYVALLSRCCSRSGLSFLRAFPYATFFVKLDPGLAQKERRLQALEIQTSGINYEAMLAAY